MPGRASTKRRMKKGAGYQAAHKAKPAGELAAREQRMKVRTKRIARAKAALGDQSF